MRKIVTIAAGLGLLLVGAIGVRFLYVLRDARSLTEAHFIERTRPQLQQMLDHYRARGQASTSGKTGILVTGDGAAFAYASHSFHDIPHHRHVIIPFLLFYTPKPELGDLNLLLTENGDLILNREHFCGGLPPVGWALANSNGATSLETASAIDLVEHWRDERYRSWNLPWPEWPEDE